jgi:hypothetical protein
VTQTHLENSRIDMAKIDKVLEAKIKSMIEEIESSPNTDIPEYLVSEDDYPDDEDNLDIDIEDYSISPEEFLIEINRCIEDGDDELEINYDDGSTLIMDIDIVKHLVENFDDEQLKEASESPENMHELLNLAFDGIYAE